MDKIEPKKYRSLSHDNAIQINKDTINFLANECCWFKKDGEWYTKSFSGETKKVKFGDYIVFNYNGLSDTTTKYSVNKDVFESSYMLDPNNDLMAIEERLNQEEQIEQIKGEIKIK